MAGWIVKMSRAEQIVSHALALANVQAAAEAKENAPTLSSGAYVWHGMDGTMSRSSEVRRVITHTICVCVCVCG